MVRADNDIYSARVTIESATPGPERPSLSKDTLPMNGEFKIDETDDAISLTTSALQASFRKKGYVSGVAGGSFVDRRTGFADPGFGLDIVDWLMEPGSDAAYRDQLPKDLVYDFNNPFHGSRAKRSIEGPQICTQAKELPLSIIRGDGFAAIQTQWRYTLAAPGKNVGSEWKQTLLFPAGKRYFISSDTITSVNASKELFLRLDMPGHIRHNHGDTFSEVYLSYNDSFPGGLIPSSEFFEDFAPDAKFCYRRSDGKIPQRFIRAYHLRDPKTGKDGPWMAGMTLAPSIVDEAWSHQRGYVCFIEEIGGHPIRPGQSFGAAYIVGYFDSIAEMEHVYDQYAGTVGIEIHGSHWKPLRR